MKKKEILIVDDELDMRIFISTLLESSGYKPIAARDGRQGIEQVEKAVPDLIILDVMMPGEGGVQMYRQLKINEAFRTIPVIMLSAVAQKTFTHYLKMLSAQMAVDIPYPEAYMEKPPEADELLALVKKFFGKPQKGRGKSYKESGNGE